MSKCWNDIKSVTQPLFLVFLKLPSIARTFNIINKTKEHADKSSGSIHDRINTTDDSQQAWRAQQMQIMQSIYWNLSK